jgi:hypothetical protein
MKESINTIIENALLVEAKKRIIEQMGDINELLKKFPSLSIFKQYITNIDKLNEFDYSIIISNINEADLLSCCNLSSINDVQSVLTKKLYLDLKKLNLNKNFDINIDIESDQSTFNLKIKINSNDEEEFGTEITNNMKKEYTEQLNDINNEDECVECGETEETVGIENDELTEVNDDSDIDVNKEIEGFKEYMKNIEQQDKLYESKKAKKKIRLTESKLIALIEKIINESIPGIDVTKTAQLKSQKDTSDHTNKVSKKIKDYLNFDGNDNPEFPHQIGKGSKSGRDENEVMAYRNKDKEEEYIQDFRGEGAQDLDFDVTSPTSPDGVSEDDFAPSKEYVDRLKKYLSGDSTTGNDQDAANVVPDKVGEKVFDATKRKYKIRREQPLNIKDSPFNSPVKREIDYVRTESKEEVDNILKEEINKIKKLSNYSYEE